MPGERPRGAPASTMTGDLQPCHVASSLGRPSQAPLEDHSPSSRTTKGAREVGGQAQAMELPETQPRQARDGEPQPPPLRGQALSSTPRKGSGPQTPPGRSPLQAPSRLVGKADGSPPKHYSLSIASSRAKAALDQMPENPPLKAAQPPEAEAPRGPGTGVPLRPGLARTKAQPTAEELGFHSCFQETPSSFTSTNYTSPSATPRPPATGPPQSRGPSPLQPSPHPEFQASGADSWPSAAENSFPGANLGAPPAESEPIPVGSRPGGSPTGVSFQFPFAALRGAGAKPFPVNTAGHAFANGPLVFAFHQPRGAWPEEAMGASPAYPLPARSAPSPLPCYQGQPGGVNPHSTLSGALSPPGAAHLAPRPFSDSLRQSLTKILPERPRSAQDGLGSPREPPSSLPQRHFPGQAYGASRVDASPGPLDTELATPGPAPPRLLWDPTAAPYPTAAKGPLAATRSAFFSGQPSPGQRLCLPQSSPWPQVLPTAGPSPHGMEMPSRLPFPAGAPEWQEDSHRALSTAGKTPGPREKLAAVRSGPDASPALFTYNGPTDPGAQPLFFGVAQPQVSPHGTPSLPPPRVVGASPSESPLPSPATNTAGSTCSSLSPMSSSPANPSSEESQLPGPCGPSAFFHPPTHPQETGSPFPSPEPPHSLPTHYQPEPAKAFPFPADGLGAEGTFQCLEETPFPHEGPEVGRGGLQGFPRVPPLYPAHHFSLSSASLDQLDVLLTCRQCDRNYSSLAAFLAHRQFCGLLLARAKDGHQRSPGPPVLPSPTTAPRVPAGAHPGMLNHSKSFLPAEDVQAEGKDDPLRTGFLPSLAATPFPLPASDLDMEDDAKLDSLITEALNGMEYQSDNPEIDSSFIDVFADEEPSGPRGPSTGQPPKTKAGVTPENKAPPPLPATTPDPQAPHPGDRGCPAQGRPKTRSLGLAPTQVDVPSQGRQQRRGKQLKLFQKDLDTSAAEGLGGGGRATLRPRRRKGSRGQRPPPCPRDLRTQASESHADPTPQAQRAATLPETRSSPRLRLPPRKDSRRRKAQDGTWGKELILKIVQQKNKHYQRLGRQVGRRGSLAAERPQPRAEDCRLQEYDYASESEEDQPPPQRGPGFRGRRCRGEKRKEVDLTQGPREGGEQQKHRKAVRQEAGGDRAPHNPEEPGGPCPDPSRSSEADGPPRSLEARAAARERGPKCADGPSLPPKDPRQVPTNTQTPEENHPPLDFPQEAKEPETVKGSALDTTELTGVLSSPASCVEGSPSLLIPGQPQPSRQDTGSPKLSGSLANMASAPVPGVGSLLDGPGCTKARISHNREEPPAHHPAEALAPMANPSSTACPKSSILSAKISGFGCDPAGFNEDPMGVPVAKKGPQPYSSPHSELFLGPNDLAGCFLEHLHPKPSAMDAPPDSSSCLCQDSEDAGSLQPLLPKSLPGTAETDPGRAASPLTLESTSLFPGLPLDRFDPPLYGSLSADRDPQVPFACADPPQKQPPADPPFPSFSLLEVPPMLPDHFPDPSGGKVLSKTCPPEQTAAPGAPALPGKGSGCGVALMSHLSEDELEIQKLVTELESQLQRNKDTPGAPRELGEAERGGRVEPGTGTGTEAPSLLPICRATMPHKDTLSAADLTVTGESTAPREGAGPAVATMEGVQQRPTATWPCPASFHPGKTAPLPCAQEDLVSGSPFSPTGASFHFQLVQKAGVSKTRLHQVEEDRDSGAPQDVCLPEPSKQPGPPLDARNLAKYSPDQELSFPKNKEVTSSQESEDTLRPLPCEQRGRLFPGPGTADGPRPETPTLEAFCSPAVHLAPDLAFQGDGAPPLDATWPFGASQSHAAQGHSAGRAGGRLYPTSGRPGFEGNEFAPAGASLMTTPWGRRAWIVPVPSPACVSDTRPGRRSQDPASSPLRQLSILGPRAAESKDGIPALQEPTPAAQSPPRGNPSDLEGGTVKGGKVACGPALGPLEGVEVTTLPTVAGHQLGLEADGHRGFLGQAEKTQVQGRASQLQPVNGGSPAGAGNLSSVNASPKTAPDGPATGAVLLEKCEGVRAAVSLQDEAPHAPSLPSPESLALALTAAHTQNAPEGWALQRASSLGLNKPMLATGDSPAPSMGDLATCAPSPSSSATPMPCSLGPLPHEDPHTSPSSATRAQGGLREQLPASPSCRDPPSPQHPPAYSPAQAPLEEVDAIPAHTDTGAGDPPVAPLPLTTSPCDPKGALAHCILQGEDSLLEDPSSRCPGSVSAVAYTHGRGSPEDSTLRIPEDSRKEKPWESPGRPTSPPLAGAVSPTMALRAADLSSTVTKDAPQAGRGPPGLEPQSRGAPSHTSPGRMPSGHSCSPSNTAHLGHREAHAVTAVPTEPPTPPGAGSDTPTCLEGEAGTSSKGPEHPGTPEAGHSGAAKVPSVTCPSTGLCLGITTAPSSTASDFQSDSPKSHRNASHQTSQGDPLCPQDLKQGPRGYKKKPVSAENGQAALGPVTCEVCTASFRSRPGLSRHKARKHRPRPGAPPQPSPAALPAQQPPGPPTQKCQPPRKKSREAPGKERPKHSRGCSSHVARGWKEVLGTPGSAHSQQQHPPSPAEHGVDVKAPASKPRPDQAGEDELHPKQAEKREGRSRRGEPTVDSASHSEGKSSKKGKLRGRRLREDSAPPVSPEVISNGCGSRPSPATASYTAPPSHCLSVEGRPEADEEQPPRWTMPGPRVMEGAAGTDLEALCTGETGAQKLPGDRMLRPGKMDGVALGEQPVGQKGALARGLRRPRETKALGVCKESGSTPAEDSSRAHSRSEEGVWEELESPLGPLGFPETSSSPVDSSTSGCLQGLPENPDTQGGVRGPEGPTPEAPSSSAEDPPSLFDDEVSFSQLFPPGGRLTRKRNPRVYGKRCEKPEPQLPTQPSVEDSPTLGPAGLPMDLSDSGSLCLCHEDPWEDEDPAGLPESFLLDGFLSSTVPGIDPWVPGLSLWALEPGKEASAEKLPSRCPEDDRPEAIPKLHMVPAAWRGLELPAPANDASSSLGDVSPEPPSLERERYDGGLPGNAHLLPLRAADLETLSTEFEMRDLCFLGPFEDPAGLPTTSFLDFEATASSRGPQNGRTEAATGTGRAQGRGRLTKGKRASYKCRVCFQRFRGLGELDLHKLAHTPAPPPTCYMCVERRFGSRELLRGHLRERHAQSKAGPWACGMCLKEVADIWMYNEHLREHAARFARKGQARRSLGDLPGGLQGGSAIAQLLSGIVEPTPKPHRDKHSVGKAGGSPGDSSGPEGEAGKESRSERAKPGWRSTPSHPDSAVTPDGVSANAPANPGSPATTPTPYPDSWTSGEPLLQAVPVHEACKDPSRDCHHCGKRFPKPFKLQRHLAVHSPQRVYLCPRCPRVYSEHGELLVHLGGAHGLREPLELQHTPLYACELCATVMHIIKKSFACSSCNYTFAKKEQFDRHMDKHPRRGRQPFTFRGVRRPGVPGQKSRALEGTLPSKRRKVAMPGSAPGPEEDSPTLSEGSLPALLQLCREVATSTTKGWPETLERPADPGTLPIRGCDRPSDHQECPPPSLSPYPAALAEGRGDCEPDRALERPENEASAGSPETLLQQALPLGASVPRPGTRDQDAEGKRAPLLFSGKRRAPAARGRGAPDHFQQDPALLPKQKQVSLSHVASEGGPGGPFHKGSATKPGGCQTSSMDRSAASTPSKAPKFPVHPRKAVGSLAPGELARGTENGMKPDTPKAKTSPSPQGSGSPRPGTKTGGGSQPQPASGQLQSETATTPAKPSFPSQSPAPDRLLPRAQAKSCTKGPREAGEQGPHGSPGPKEKGESSMKRKKGQAPGAARTENVGSFGRAPSAPDRPPRTPRKQATPSRVLPAKPKLNSQNKPRPPPSEQQKAEPAHVHRKDRPGKAFPQGRPLLRAPKRGRAVHGAEPAEPHTRRTAEAQSDLLSQLFGQRLTGFKIPLKKDASE
uniref:Zinc finger protein 469 n=1 Tax=Aotus nancymaae TaxID=37293 RepID=A0A2K5ESK9_AOTNA